MDGVVNEVPVPREDPPLDAAYQFMVPSEPVAAIPTVPGPHLLPFVVVFIMGLYTSPVSDVELRQETPALFFMFTL